MSAIKGRRQSLEHIKKRIESRYKNGNYFGGKHSDEHKRKISEGCKKVGSGLWMKGRKMPPESRIKKRPFSGSKHWNWRGGITTNNEKIRKSVEMRLWREAVFAKDNFTCQICGKRGGRLEADHIKPFSLFPEFRTSIENGRTLCKNCHVKTDTYAGRLKRFKVEVL